MVKTTNQYFPGKINYNHGFAETICCFSKLESTTNGGSIGNRFSYFWNPLSKSKTKRWLGSLPCSGKYHNKRPEMNRSIMAWLANQVHELKSAKSVFVCEKDHQHVWWHTVGNKTRGAALDTTWKITIQQHLMHVWCIFFLCFSSDKSRYVTSHKKNMVDFAQLWP